MKLKGRTRKKKKPQTLTRLLNQFDKMTRKYRIKGQIPVYKLPPGKYFRTLVLVQNVNLKEFEKGA